MNIHIVKYFCVFLAILKTTVLSDESLQSSFNEWASKPSFLDELHKVVFPVGYTYIQLPKEEPPTKIWPKLNWRDVSLEYAGVFFRVNGGGSGAFGHVQEENAPTVSHVGSYFIPRRNLSQVVWHDEIPIPKNGYSKLLSSGTKAVHVDDYMALNFKRTTGEIRPRNMAIRVWRRV